MRVDLEVLLPLLKGSELYKRFRIIAELEKYTLLTPPYEGDDVQELFNRAQKELNFRFATDYYWLLKCCDGGLLFTNELFSVLAPDDPDADLVSMNHCLREQGLIPEGSAAIGVTNYGAWILQCESGEKAMGLWDSEENNGEGGYIARYVDLYDWLDDVIHEAHFLLENDGLPVIDDFEEEDGGEY